MIRKKRLYTKPKKLYQKGRIKEENALMKKYALKNKKEIWKTLAKVNYFRSRAKDLAKLPIEKQQILFNKLNRLGLNVHNIADVLALKIENLLERRLTTVISRKNMAKTPNHARQLIVHKKVAINDKIINVPSYLVPVDEEPLISIKENSQKKADEKSDESSVKLPADAGKAD